MKPSLFTFFFLVWITFPAANLFAQSTSHQKHGHEEVSFTAPIAQLAVFDPGACDYPADFPLLIEYPELLKLVFRGTYEIKKGTNYVDGWFTAWRYDTIGNLCFRHLIRIEYSEGSIRDSALYEYTWHYLDEDGPKNEPAGEHWTLHSRLTLEFEAGSEPTRAIFLRQVENYELEDLKAQETFRDAPQGPYTFFRIEEENPVRYYRKWYEQLYLQQAIQPEKPRQMSLIGQAYEIMPIGPDPKADIKLAFAQNRMVRVSTVQELIKAIAPNTTIVLAPGEYDLTGAAKDSESPFLCAASNIYEEVDCESGTTFLIQNLSNCILRGDSVGPAAHLITREPSDLVLGLRNCRNVRLRNLRLGHLLPPEEEDWFSNCSGEVLGLYGCSNIEVIQSELYGCGSTGVIAYDTRALNIDASVIHGCSFGAIRLDGCEKVAFNNGYIQNNTYKTLLEILNTKGFSMENSVIMNNWKKYQGKPDYIIDNLSGTYGSENNVMENVSFTDCPILWNMNDTLSTDPQVQIRQSQKAKTNPLLKYLPELPDSLVGEIRKQKPWEPTSLNRYADIDQNRISTRSKHDLYHQLAALPCEHKPPLMLITTMAASRVEQPRTVLFEKQADKWVMHRELLSWVYKTSLKKLLPKDLYKKFKSYPENLEYELIAKDRQSPYQLTIWDTDTYEGPTRVAGPLTLEWNAQKELFFIKQP